jgi:tetratricopeptide (TPR) repeat protein
VTEDADEHYLASLFERFLDDLGRGRPIDLDAAAAERPDLRSRIAETIALAHEAAVAKPAQRPRVAGHEILAELGRGGMGAVYLALDRDLGRRVALKVLPPSYAAGGRGRDRFLREARAVARLQHANIVPVHDLGEDDGAPWFTMEFVEGRTLADAVARLRAKVARPETLVGADLAEAGGFAPRDASYADAAARLALELAEALAHAHAAGVVHRDVKPSNVMLRKDGRAMLFDFGLADVAAEGSLTLTGAFMGTPHYASPEQALGRADADHRTDVWSLGATLYELLTLAQPFQAATAHAVLAKVQKDDPAPPRALNPRVPADLAAVCLTAMEKDPARRYLTAADFAADLRRFLANEPVAARPVGPLGRLARRVQRHPAVAAAVVATALLVLAIPAALLLGQKALAAAAVAATALLVLGAPTALLVQQRRANEKTSKARDAAVEAKKVAERERDNAREIAAALADILTSADPERDGRDVKVADVLERASRECREKFEAHPATRAALQVSIGRAWLGLGLFDAAAREFEAALVHLRNAGAGEVRALVEALNFLGMTVTTRHEDDRGESAFREARELALRHFGPTDLLTLETTQGLASLLVRVARFDEAEALLRPAVATARATFGETSDISLYLHGELASLLMASDEMEEALRLYAQTHAWRVAGWGPDHPRTLSPQANLGYLHCLVGDLDAAREILSDCLARERRIHGDGHPTVLVTEQFLLGVLYRQGRPDLVEPRIRELLAGWEATDGPNGMRTLGARTLLGDLLFATGRAEEAEPHLRAAVEGRSQRFGRGHGTTAWSAAILARLLSASGRGEEAERLLLDVRAAALRLGRSGRTGVRLSTQALADLYERTGRPEDAARLRAAAS